MFIILKKGHQPGVYVPLRALFLVFNSLFLFEFLPLSGFWISLVMLLVSSIF